jgi:predicted transglutaminase-like cysteine proteinase
LTKKYNISPDPVGAKLGAQGQMMIEVELFVNKNIAFKPNPQHLMQTAKETFTKKTGDSIDFATAKAALLAQLGFSPSKDFAFLVGSTETGEHHAVLGVRFSRSSEWDAQDNWIILDSRAETINAPIKQFNTLEYPPRENTGQPDYVPVPERGSGIFTPELLMDRSGIYKLLRTGIIRGQQYENEPAVPYPPQQRPPTQEKSDWLGYNLMKTTGDLRIQRKLGLTAAEAAKFNTREIQSFLDSLKGKGKSQGQMIYAVDDFVNHRITFKQKDPLDSHWQSIKETFEKRTGDSIDYVIAKAELLARLGIFNNSKDLAIVIGSTEIGDKHAVLGVRDSMDWWYILDNRSETIKTEADNILTPDIQELGTGTMFTPDLLIDGTGIYKLIPTDIIWRKQYENQPAAPYPPQQEQSHAPSGIERLKILPPAQRQERSAQQQQHFSEAYIRAYTNAYTKAYDSAAGMFRQADEYDKTATARYNRGDVQGANLSKELADNVRQRAQAVFDMMLDHEMQLELTGGYIGPGSVGYPPWGPDVGPYPPQSPQELLKKTGR